MLYRELDNAGSPLEKHIWFFFPNDTVFRYFDYLVIFPNLLAASYFMLAVETL